MDMEITKDLMQTLDLDQLAKTNSVRWYGHVLKKDKNNFLIRTLDFKVMKRDRPKKTRLISVVEQSSWAEGN